MEGKSRTTREVNIQIEDMGYGRTLVALCLVLRTPGCPLSGTPEGLHSSLIDGLWLLIVYLPLAQLVAATGLLICAGLLVPGVRFDLACDS